MYLNIKLRDFCIAQFALVTALVILGLVAYIFRDSVLDLSGTLYRLLDVGDEKSLPTYFSTLNLLFSSILIYIIYRHEKASDRSDRFYWLFLSLLFLFLSFDEFASIHEKFAKVYDSLVEKNFIYPVLETHGWILFGIAFVLIIVLALIPFLRNLPKDTRRYFLISGFVFVTGAIGFELVGAIMLKTKFVDSPIDIAYLLRRILEEGFEMYGIAMFNCALYREISIRRMSLELLSDTAIERSDDFFTLPR